MAASDEAEPSDKDCEIVDAPASFKSDLRKHCGDIIKKTPKLNKHCYRPTIKPLDLWLQGNFVTVTCIS